MPIHTFFIAHVLFLMPVPRGIGHLSHVQLVIIGIADLVLQFVDDGDGFTTWCPNLVMLLLRALWRLVEEL